MQYKEELVKLIRGKYVGEVGMLLYSFSDQTYGVRLSNGWMVIVPLNYLTR